MQRKGLFIFVEGPDDDRFVKGVLNQLLGERYSWLKTYQYATKKRVQVCAFIRSIRSMGADYIFLTDLDLGPCITFKKEQTRQKYVELNEDKLIVVVKEIESWYLAGLNNSKQNELGVSNYNRTDQVTKEQFNQKIPKAYISKIDFMREILKNYSVTTARSQNTSFEYFLNKYSVE